MRSVGGNGSVCTCHARWYSATHSAHLIFLPSLLFCFLWKAVNSFVFPQNRSRTSVDGGPKTAFDKAFLMESSPLLGTRKAHEARACCLLTFSIGTLAAFAAASASFCNSKEPSVHIGVRRRSQDTCCALQRGHGFFRFCWKQRGGPHLLRPLLIFLPPASLQRGFRLSLDVLSM